ncbi:MAG: cation diffusion facilitator family transporter [Candidatus Nitrosocosmicus sp.]
MIKGNENHPKRSKNKNNKYVGNNKNGQFNSIYDDINIVNKHKEKTKVALISIIASSSLALFKFVIAQVTGSLGILSESLHSGLDIMAAVMTLYAIRMALRPPDLEHNYGYAKFESLTSLAETVLLFIAAGWIFYDGFQRIFFIHSKPEITIFSFGIMIISIVVDYGRSKALYRISHKYGSQALEADALHFRTDMLTSGVVLVGLVIVYLFRIADADSYCAIAVAGIIVYTSLGLGRRTLDVLLDKAPKGIQGQILESITGFEGVKNVHSVRVRKVGTETFVDLHIEVPRIFTHDKAHKIATNVENKIRGEILPNSDVVVHVDAIEDDLTETIKDKIMLIATNYPAIKNIHSLYLSTPLDQSLDFIKKNEGTISNRLKENNNMFLHLYLDVQIDSNLDLNTAHDIVDDFERKIKEDISSIKNITTHIETEVDIESTIGKEEIIDQHLTNKIKSIALSVDGVSDCKDIALVFAGNEVHITLTIKLNPFYIKIKDNDLDLPNGSQENKKLSVVKAHQIATDIQNRILENTEATRVIIHTEPE